MLRVKKDCGETSGEASPRFTPTIFGVFKKQSISKKWIMIIGGHLHSMSNRTCVATGRNSIQSLINQSVFSRHNFGHWLSHFVHKFRKTFSQLLKTLIGVSDCSRCCRMNSHTINTNL